MRGGKTQARDRAVREALEAGQTVLLCRDGAAIQARLEAGRIVYQELPDGEPFKRISIFDWMARSA